MVNSIALDAAIQGYNNNVINKSTFEESIIRVANKRGFTLIELLVVIAIIAILAAILFPVFARARENARRASCQSNQKQIALGMMMYVQDYDEHFPSHYGYFLPPDPNSLSWARVLQPYVKSTQLFFCPSDTIHNSQLGITTANISYGYNWFYFSIGQSLNAMAADKYPSETILLADTGLNATGYVIQPGSASYSPRDVHLEGCNFTFADGHVKWMHSAPIIADTGPSATSLWGNRP